MKYAYIFYVLSLLGFIGIIFTLFIFHNHFLKVQSKVSGFMINSNGKTYTVTLNYSYNNMNYTKNLLNVPSVYVNGSNQPIYNTNQNVYLYITNKHPDNATLTLIEQSQFKIFIILLIIFGLMFLNIIPALIFTFKKQKNVLI